jgi:hypothetical protein
LFFSEYVCQALSYLFRGNIENIKAISKAVVLTIPRMVQLFQSTNVSILKSIVRVVSILLAVEIEPVLDAGEVKALQIPLKFLCSYTCFIFKIP